MNEEKSTRRKRFEKVAGNRVQIILNTFDNLENCANRNNYQYDEEDIKKMEKTIREKFNEVIKKFNGELNKSNKVKFTF